MPINRKSIKNSRKKRGGVLQELLVQASKLAVPVGLLIMNEGANLISPKSKRKSVSKGGKRVNRKTSSRRRRNKSKQTGGWGTPIYRSDIDIEKITSNNNQTGGGWYDDIEQFTSNNNQTGGGKKPDKKWP